MNKKRILITGGSGFIGGALVSRLVQEGYSTRVLDNQSRGTDEHLADVRDKIEFVNADIRNFDAVREACRGIDLVFHLAFVNGTEYFYSKPELVLDVGVKGMTNIMDACLKEKIGELIVASSSEVYQTPSIVPTDESAALCIPDPLNPRYSYAAGKILSEIMTINYGKKYFDRALLFRPHNVYGPNMGWEHVIPQFCSRMKTLVRSSADLRIPFLIKGTGQEKRAFVHINDFIDGLMIVFEKGEHLNIYHIGTQEEITIETVAREIGHFYTKEIDIIPSDSVAGGTNRRCPDISKLKKLGFNPKIDFKEGLKLTAQWYDAHEPPVVEQVENSEEKSKQFI